MKRRATIFFFLSVILLIISEYLFLEEISGRQRIVFALCTGLLTLTSLLLIIYYYRNIQRH